MTGNDEARSHVRRAAAVVLCAGLAIACAASSGVDDGAGGASAATGSGGAPASGVGPGGSSDGGNGPHGCFSTESECGGKCVDTKTHMDHCGACDTPCVAGPNQTAKCIASTCVQTCQDGFTADQGACKNFFGAHESWPQECPGCNQANAWSGDCGCPAWTTELPLAVQSDCPGTPMRSPTTVTMCVTSGLSDQSDFGGAFQVDDIDGWCGATAQCRVGNPFAGGACACPPGFDPIGLRSIVRLPCDGTEGGTTIVLCGKMAAPVVSFGGAFQVDDFEPFCRIQNPWTGDCSCPMGTVDRVYRVMVDGPAGLYGSTLHVCTP